MADRIPSSSCAGRPQAAPATAAGSRTLEGQRALVTGANSGIGAAIARALAEAGATVVVSYGGTDADGHDAAGRAVVTGVVEDIRRGGGEALALCADVSQELQVEALFAAAINHFGGLDILVNNARVNSGGVNNTGLQRDVRLYEITLGDWESVLAMNLTGHFLCSRAAVREFLRRGSDPTRSAAMGKIICISSPHERLPWARHANDAASKGGVRLLIQTMAQELAVHRIRVNGISPGAIGSATQSSAIDNSAWNTPAAEAELLRLIPYGRIGQPRDIANAAVWLASDASDYVTGATLHVDGGMTLSPGFDRRG